jgi:hypothetical protein
MAGRRKWSVANGKPLAQNGENGLPILRLAESPMPNFARPATYMDKRRFAKRVVKAALFRPDPKQAVRELCEALSVITAALIERELETRPEAKEGEEKKRAEELFARPDGLRGAHRSIISS